MAIYNLPYTGPETAEYLAKARDMSGVPLDDGIYSGVKTYTTYDQYLNDNGALFKLSPTVNLGYTINTSLYPQAKDDPNLVPYVNFESAGSEAIGEFNDAGDQAIADFNQKGDEAIYAVGFRNVGVFAIGETVQNSQETLTYDGEEYNTTAGSFPYTTDGATPDLDSADWYNVTLESRKTVARSLNALDSQVIYATDTVTPIPDYIYDSSQQRSYMTPLEARGKFISSVIGDQLTTTDAAVYTMIDLYAKQYVIKASDFGIDFSGSVDSTEGLNNALQALRDATFQPVAGILSSTSATLDLQGARIRCDGSINATGLINHGWSITGNGAVIISKATGRTAFDLVTSRWGTISQLTVTAADADDVLQGIQIGRDETLATANSLVFDNVTVMGYWSRTSFYNFASEVDTHIAPTYINYKDTDDSYAFILDGDHEWGIVSDFVTAAPQHTHISNIQHTFIGGSLRKLISGPTMWITQTKQLKFYNHYITCIDDHAITIADSGGSFRDLDFDVHFEKNGMESCIKFDVTTNPAALLVTDTVIPGFKFKDHAPQAAKRVFWAQGTLNVKLMGTIDIPFYQQTPTLGLCQPRPQFEIVGDVSLPNLDSNNGLKTYGRLIPYDGTLTGSVGGAPEVISTQDDKERVFKGRVVFTSTEEDNIQMSNLSLLKNVEHEAGATKMTPLPSTPDFGAVTGVFAIDDGSNWSGVNATGLPRPVFHDGTAWIAMT